MNFGEAVKTRLNQFFFAIINTSLAIKTILFLAQINPSLFEILEFNIKFNIENATLLFRKDPHCLFQVKAVILLFHSSYGVRFDNVLYHLCSTGTSSIRKVWEGRIDFFFKSLESIIVDPKIKMYWIHININVTRA